MSINLPSIYIRDWDSLDFHIISEIYCYVAIKKDNYYAIDTDDSFTNSTYPNILPFMTLTRT